MKRANFLLTFAFAFLMVFSQPVFSQEIPSEVLELSGDSALERQGSYL